MPSDPRLATVSALCLLSWLFMFGLFSEAAGRTGDSQRLYILTGTISGVSEDGALEIFDGRNVWDCRVCQGVSVPAAGAVVIAVCTMGTDGEMYAVSIGSPWAENLF